MVFEGASTDYTGVDKLEGAAKRYYKFYKKMFDEFAARNEGNNAEGGSAEGVRYAMDNDQHAKITIDSTEHERYLALKGRRLSLSAHTDMKKLNDIMSKFDITQDTLDFSKYGDKSRLFVKMGDEFGVYKKYNNEDVDIVFNFSKGNLKESLHKQVRNYRQFAKLLSCFDTVIENAIGIEVHNRNTEGYKVDLSLKQCYVLASAFVDGENIVPVKLEVKEFTDKENALHVAIALESIKKDEFVAQEVTENGVAQQYAPSSNISIADFFAKINPSDESFYKYIPKEFLQRDSKIESDIRFALPMDDEAIEATLDEAQADGAVFDRDAIINRGAPIVPGTPREKMYTRAHAYNVFKKMSDNRLLSSKSRKEFYDTLYRAMNSFETQSQKQGFAHEAAEYYVAKLLEEGQAINPEYDTARDVEMSLHFGIGKIAFTPEDMAELRARLDDAEIKSILGRWGKKKSGTPSYMLDMFTNEVSTTIPGMSYVGKMHPVNVQYICK